jgi:hypothetical protein
MAEPKKEIVEISLPPGLEQPPKNEIARISVLPRLAPTGAVDAIPRPLCWAALGISALIFLIQIWNYVVS